MINLRSAIVTSIIKERAFYSEIEVQIDGIISKAVNYPALTGPVAVADTVLVNTIAVDLSLGTGGCHFVLANLSRPEFKSAGPGHIMKLRYTPLQHAALSVEEEAGEHHGAMKDIAEVDGMPVIACALHSQLLPIVLTIAEKSPQSRIAYIMTDGGALPASFSETADWLKREGLISATITAGQAFGGDFEAVNIYSAIAAAKVAVGADIAVAAMGPGIVGTATKLGHTGMEQGQIINAAHSLGAKPIAVLRISQADARSRHRGISHHCLAALSIGALAPALVPVPKLALEFADLNKLILDQLEKAGIDKRHQVKLIDNAVTMRVLTAAIKAGGPIASTMGRSVDKEPVFFLAAGAAAIAAVELMDHEVNEKELT